MTKRLIWAAFLSLLSLQLLAQSETRGNVTVRRDGGDPIVIGTVLSLGLTASNIFNVTGSPVTTSGTIDLALASQLKNLFLASPDNATGVPTFRSLVPRDMVAAGCTDGQAFKQTSATVIGCITVGGTTIATDTIWDAAGDMVYASAADTGAKLVKGTATQLLHSGNAPTWSAVDLTADVSGLLPYANLANGTAISVLGHAANSTGVNAPIQCTAASGNVIRESGSALSCGTLAAGAYADNTIAPARIAFAATDRIACRDTAAAGSGEECTTSNLLDMRTGTQGDLIYRGASTWDGLGAGTVGSLLQTGGASANPSYISPPFDYTKWMSFYDDFLSASAIQWTATSSGSGATSSLDGNSSDANHPGAMRQETGTTTTGRNALVVGGPNQTIMGPSGGSVFEAIVKLPTLSDGTDTYQVWVGLCDQTGAGDCTDGIDFTYSSTLNSGNWTMNACTTTTCTATTTGIAATTAYTRLKWILNAARSSVQFLVDDVSGGTVTTNIPTTTTQTQLELKIIKSAGTNNRFLTTDVVKFTYPLSR